MKRDSPLPPDSGRPLGLILRALDFAARKHRDQRRKDASTSPYINHPIALTEVLCNEAGIDDPVVIAAALLHDTIEDTQTTARELLEAFGEQVAGIVEEVTDDNRLPKAERKRLQIEHAAALTHEAKLVKLADKIVNVRDIAHNPPPRWSIDRKREYFDWAKQVVDRIRGTDATLEAAFDAAYRARP